MKKKTLIATITTLFVLIFCISYSFAANNIGQEAVDGIRNVVGGAENVVEDAAGGIAGGVRNGVTGVKDTAENVTNGAMTSDNTNNGNYNAARTTSTRMSTNEANTFLGMNGTTWAWIIMAVVGIIIVGLVWYYGKQQESSYHHNNDNH